MWPSVTQWWFELGYFFQTGGWVLYLILAVCFVMAILILERLAFRFFSYRAIKLQVMSLLASDIDWRTKLSLICDMDIALRGALPMLKTLIMLCPLIGLLGTVTGMIQVFDSLAIYGTGNPRMMASGVASATFPTMTGMAVAVVGLLFYGRIEQWANKERSALQNIKAALFAAH